MLKVFNTLSKKKEEFKPLDLQHIKMYVCGPTVYARPHIGNMRSIVIYDVIFRFLKSQYPKVTYVRNITDIDDKILDAITNLDIRLVDFTNNITKQFHQDSIYLGCLEPDIEPKATQEIDKMIELMDKLIEKGYAYISQGHVLFLVEKYKEYGLLSNRNLNEMIAGSRVAIESYKKNPEDFILWKPAPKNEIGWETKYGYGRPGWHIECSAMSVKYLGENFDIHGGGIDLQFPHHENEIAQSKCAFEDSSFASYWLHNGFLTVDGQKMSKSLGNVITCEDLRKKNILGNVARLALLSTHYRKPMDFNDDLITNSRISIEKFYEVLKDINYASNENLPQNAVDCLNDDFNIARFIALMFSYFKDIRDTHDVKSKEKLAGQLFAMGKIIGVFNSEPAQTNQTINFEIIKLADERLLAKNQGNYPEADKIRQQIDLLGYKIEDLPNKKYLIITK